MRDKVIRVGYKQIKVDYTDYKEPIKSHVHYAGWYSYRYKKRHNKIQDLTQASAQFNDNILSDFVPDGVLNSNRITFLMADN